MRRVFALVWSGLWALPTALFSFLFYHDYWKLRGCFSPETGACFVEEHGLPLVYHDSNFIWAIPAVVCLVLVLLGLLAAWKSKAAPTRS